jgi:hypothetical protein
MLNRWVYLIALEFVFLFDFVDLFELRLNGLGFLVVSLACFFDNVELVLQDALLPFSLSILL